MIVGHLKDELLDHVEKDELTEQDRNMYKETSQCSQGHEGSVVLVEEKKD